jgi:hypothetical protein
MESNNTGAPNDYEFVSTITEVEIFKDEVKYDNE